jgi:23S rRNA pseudouridine1911/1915/1917 synthase
VGTRLDVALIRAHRELSRRKARDVIEKGQVTVDGQMVRDAGRRVREDAKLLWDPNRRALPRARTRIPILHADAHLLVVDKPAGLLSVPSGPGVEGEDTALLRVREYVAHLDPHRPYVGLVHRLDRDTSGAIAFALSAPVRTGLIALFRAHRIVRRYHALVEGVPPSDAGTIDAPLAEEYRGGRRRVARRGEAARPALTRWRVVERLAGAALVEVELETGRQHQIRVHLAHVGLPVIGDLAYRERASAPLLAVPRQMLHAGLLGFRHPVTGEEVAAASPLPADFRTALGRLRARRR